MSYDLMVFAPKAAPAGRREFMDWYHRQVRWDEGHDYNDPEVSAPELRAWFREMITYYPPMNGPFSSKEIDNSKITDYSVGINVIYAAFAWSEAEDAFKCMTKLAEKHQVGFFDVSSTNGGVWMPDSSGKYICVHGTGAGKDKNSDNQKWWQWWKRK